MHLGTSKSQPEQVNWELTILDTDPMPIAYKFVTLTHRPRSQGEIISANGHRERQSHRIGIHFFHSVVTFVHDNSHANCFVWKLTRAIAVTEEGTIMGRRRVCEVANSHASGLGCLTPRPSSDVLCSVHLYRCRRWSLNGNLHSSDVAPRANYFCRWVPRFGHIKRGCFFFHSIHSLTQSKRHWFRCNFHRPK